MSSRTIYIVDRVVLTPGSARSFIDAYLSEYAPTARERGMTLDRLLVSPPVWVDGETNTVTATWTVPGPAQWWQAAVRGRHDPGPARWWASKAPLIVERSRSMEAAVDDVHALCDLEGASDV